MLKRSIYWFLLGGALFAVGTGSCQVQNFGDTLKTFFQDFILQVIAAAVT